MKNKNYVSTLNYYRSDIDGLRAIAILSVIFFHLEIEMFSGGYIGVDVFFVISGFLITKLIWLEYKDSSKLNFSNFYIRRLRRLFPALCFTLIITLIFSIFLFSPQLLERFGGSLFFSITNLSNFYFWSEADYFDFESTYKPLQHTWSLSVEEQFYLLWPLCLIFLLKLDKDQRCVKFFLLIILIISLYGNLLFQNGDILWLNKILPWFKEGWATIFYLAPFRFFEFSIGAILVWILAKQPKNKIILEMFLIIGLLMIFLSIFFYHENMAFPTYNGLLPCFGTALSIYGGTAKWSGTLLRNKLMTWIGLRSYSLYLIHWPIIVFYKYIHFNILNYWDVIIIFFLSTIASHWMYKHVEKPFRQLKNDNLEDNNKFFLIITLSLTLLLSILAISIWKNDGWTWRLADEQKKYNNLKGADFKRKYYGGRGSFGSSIKNLNSDIYPQTIILTAGDSHARHYINGLQNIFGDKSIQHVVEGCSLATLNYCYLLRSRKIKSNLSDVMVRKKNMVIKLQKSNLPIIISQKWLNDENKGYKHISLIDGTEINFNNIDDYVNFLVNNLQDLNQLLGGSIIVFGQVPVAGIHPLDCLTRPFYGHKNCETNKVDNKITIQFNKKMKKELRRINIPFFSPSDILCKSIICKVIDAEGKILYSDNGHLSIFGSRLLIRRWIKDYGLNLNNYK